MPFGREKRVLDYVNSARASIGLDALPSLLPGACEDGMECPIANSLVYGAPVGMFAEVGAEIHVTDRMGCKAVADYTPPLFISEWIRDFDAGKIPEMIA